MYNLIIYNTRDNIYKDSVAYCRTAEIERNSCLFSGGFSQFSQILAQINLMYEFKVFEEEFFGNPVGFSVEIHEQDVFNNRIACMRGL